MGYFWEENDMQGAPTRSRQMASFGAPVPDSFEDEMLMQRMGADPTPANYTGRMADPGAGGTGPYLSKQDVMPGAMLNQSAPASNLARSLAAPDAPMSMANAAQAIGTGLNPSAYFGMAPMAMGAVPPQARILDGFHGAGGTDPVMSGGQRFTPGAGYTMGMGGQPYSVAHNNDALFSSGAPSVPRQWTEADLEPTHTLGASGFNYTQPSHAVTQGSASLPLFRADMANRAQMTNFAAEMAANANRQMFQAHENEKDRGFRREQYEANNSVKKDVNLQAATAQGAPPEMRMTKIDEMESRREVTPQQASALRIGALLDQAKGAGLTPGSGLDFYKYISGNFDDKKMLKSDLISKLQQMNVPSFNLEQIANPAGTGSMGSMALGTLRNWLGMDRNPDEVRGRNFAGSLLMPRR